MKTIKVKILVLQKISLGIFDCGSQGLGEVIIRAVSLDAGCALTDANSSFGQHIIIGETVVDVDIQQPDKTLQIKAIEKEIKKTEQDYIAKSAILNNRLAVVLGVDK